MAPDGIPQMLRDAELGYECEQKLGTRWLLSARRAMGAAYLLLGRPQEAITVLRDSLALSRDRPDLTHTRVFTLGYLVFAATELGDRRDAQRWAVEAGWLVSQQHLGDTIYGAIAYTAGALAHNQRGDQTEAARQLENVRRLRPLLRTGPWLNADLGLTPAELRIVAFLRTHLSLQDIADRLHLARPTVKTHVSSIYVKLGVTSRSDAVEVIEQAGLESTETKLTMPVQDLDRRRDAEPPLADGCVDIQPFWPMPHQPPQP